MNRALRIVQGLLAALFLFAGGLKLAMPIEELTAQLPLPGPNRERRDREKSPMREEHP